MYTHTHTHTHLLLFGRVHIALASDNQLRTLMSAYVSIRQHMSAYVRRQHKSAYVSIRQHTSAPHPDRRIPLHVSVFVLLY